MNKENKDVFLKVLKEVKILDCLSFLPIAYFTMNKENKDVFLKVLKEVKVPDG